VCPTCGADYRGFTFCPDDGARLRGATIASGSPLIGQILDKRYRIIGQVGEGGSAEVFEALHIHLQRKVALKIMRRELLSNARAVERFQREATVASDLQHPNIVRIEDFCVLANGSPCLAMEWLDGECLGERLEDGPMPIGDAVTIAAQICAGLTAAHEVDVIHRDLKPDNIYLTEGPRGEHGAPLAKILDFGIAKFINDVSPVTKAGMLMGTPHYVSPEQAHALPLDARTDIYSLGVMLYEMVTGEVPFDADTALGVLRLQADRAPTPPRIAAPDREISADLERLILRCLEKRPERRFQAAAEVGRALLDLAPASAMTLPRLGFMASANPVEAIDPADAVTTKHSKLQRPEPPPAAVDPAIAELVALGKTFRVKRMVKKSRPPPAAPRLARSTARVDRAARSVPAWLVWSASVSAVLLLIGAIVATLMVR
jgi:serine/threonine-protein kinase